MIDNNLIVPFEVLSIFGKQYFFQEQTDEMVPEENAIYSLLILNNNYFFKLTCMLLWNQKSVCGNV